MLLKQRVVVSSKGGNATTTTVVAGPSTSSMTGTTRGTAMRMTMATSSTMTSRIFRKGYRIPSKKHPGKALPGKLHSLQRIGPGKLTPGKRIPQRPHPPPCDNSNDSGLGFDQHVEHVQSQTSLASRSSMSAKLTPFEHDDEIVTDDSSDLFSCSPKSSLSLSSSPSSSSSLSSQNGGGQYNDLNGLQINNRIKRRKIVDSLVEINEDACSEDIFIQKIASSSAPPAPSKMIASGPRQVRAALKRQPAQTQNNIVTSSNGQVQLEILSQPEQQHRARYQTEGSRGAVKDRSGNGFPIVRLVGYNKPAVLQVFIGTDVGKVAPHMFYQACKVSGKNSTPCNEKKVEGTMFIEIEFKPENDMTVTCDCVGILKERNVDVEHRFPDHLAQKSKKKSTRCRMVFRTQLTNEDGSHLETLQVCSNAIICTQPPGVPEVSKKSLDSCPVEGGLELFIIGKNFLKDTFVVFKESIDSPQGSLANSWEAKVVPDKEYLQQTHLICVVPPYFNQTIHKPIKVELFVISSGKKSETHSFMYTPANSHTTQSAASTMSNSSLHSALSGAKDGNIGQWASVNGSCIEPKLEIDDAMGMMPPPPTTAIPMGVRRSSASSTMLSDQITQLKTEILDENSSHSTSDSMDHFPVVVPPTVENLVNNSVMEHPFHTVRKQSLDVMDMRNIPMIQSTNFSQQQLIQDGRETVDKFISNITANMTTPGEHTIADFVHARAVATEQHVQMNQLITNLSSPQAESPTTMERSRSNSMSTNSSTSPQSSNTGFESSISHDIILNSNTAASLMINPSTTSQSSQQQQAEQITTDIIMNSSVAPTVLCPQNDPMTLNQVAMAATSILSDIAAVQSQDHVTNNIINNIIGANVSTPQQVVSTADTAMSVMMSLTEGQSQVTQMLNNQAPVINTNTLVNMLNQQPPLGTVPPPATNAGFLNSTMPAVQMAAINSLTTQESLMVPPTHLVGQPVEPQEVSAMSAMSDQDLISYINPSAFDQV